MGKVEDIREHRIKGGRNISKQEQGMIDELSRADVAYADDYVPDAKGKIAIVDYYKKPNSKGIDNAKNTIIEAGYTPEVISHSKAKELIKKGLDFSDIYQGAFLSGSGKSWNKAEEMSKSGKHYMEYNDPVANHLVSGIKKKIPVYGACHGGYLLYKELNPEHRIINTGEMHRETDKEGDAYYHQYGMSAEHIDDKIKNVETFNHAGEKLVKRIEYDNVRISQPHAERTEVGKKDVKYFFDKHIKAKDVQAAEDYTSQESATGTYGK